MLLAEDDDAMRALLAGVLRRAGYRVVEVRDGAEVIDVVAPKWSPPERFLAIVSDVAMPRLSGLDVLAVLRSARSALPVILVTASADEAVRAEADFLGAQAVLEKPLVLGHLLSELERAAAA